MKKPKKGREKPEESEDDLNLDDAFDEEDLEELDGGEFDFDNDDDR